MSCLKSATTDVSVVSGCVCCGKRDQRYGSIGSLPFEAQINIVPGFTVLVRC